jgi:uncharacterized delta-60 repeat protein
LAGLATLAPPAIATAGDLDPTFGTGGKVTTDFGSVNEEAAAVALQTDGKIVAAGTTGGGMGGGEFALARYNLDGSLDPTFGSGGKVTTGFGGVTGAFAVAIQADGKIFAAGNGGGEAALARYNPKGPRLN